MQQSFGQDCELGVSRHPGRAIYTSSELIYIGLECALELEEPVPLSIDWRGRHPCKEPTVPRWALSDSLGGGRLHRGDQEVGYDDARTQSVAL